MANSPINPDVAFPPLPIEVGASEKVVSRASREGPPFILLPTTFWEVRTFCPVLRPTKVFLNLVLVFRVELGLVLTKIEV